MGKNEEEEGGEGEGREGRNLLGSPTFEEVENGRFKCVETGHEVLPRAMDAYSQTKHCRLGLIDAALATQKPPLNMFRQDPLSRSKLICNLTGVSVNKSEEHIWKHINGRRFLNLLDKMEVEKQKSNGVLPDQHEQTPEKTSKLEEENLRSKKKKQEENDNKFITEVRNSSDKDSDSGDADFWMPPVGDCRDFDNGGDQLGSDPKAGPDMDDANVTDAITEEDKDEARELSKRTKRMSIEIGPSSYASRKKKKKIKAT